MQRNAPGAQRADSGAQVARDSSGVVLPLARRVCAAQRHGSVCFTKAASAAATPRLRRLADRNGDVLTSTSSYTLPSATFLMLIISAGMAKSGSTYAFHLLNGLAVTAGFADSLASREKHRLEGFLGKQNNFVNRLLWKRLGHLWWVAAKEGRFVVKTHEPLNGASKFLIRCSAVRTVYIYRDPRDCLLSALDYGAKVRERGFGPEYFAKLQTFDDALREVKKWIAIWRAFQSTAGVLSIRYEDLLSTPDDVLKRCADYLKLRVDAKGRRKVLWDYSRDNPARRGRMPLNKAVAYRYRTEMPPEQRRRFRDEFGDNLVKMDYALD